MAGRATRHRVRRVAVSTVFAVVMSLAAASPVAAQESTSPDPAEVTAADALDSGFSADVLVDAGFSTADLLDGGAEASELLSAGASLDELEDAGRRWLSVVGSDGM